MKDDVLLDVLFRIKDSIVALDNNFIITYVNQEFADTVGFQVSEMIGKNIWTLLPRAVETIAYKEIVEATAKKEARHFEWTGVYSNRFLETTIFPSDKGVTTISRDITKRKQAEEALRKSEAKYRQIIDIAEEGIWFAKPDGVTILVNKKMANMLGYNPEDLTGKIGVDFLVKGQEQIVAQTRKELDENKRIQREYQFHRKDGTTLWTIAKVAPIFDENGQHIANVAMHTNITERKKAEEELQGNEERLNMAQKIAHMGSWEYYAKEDKAIWSKELFSIFGLKPQPYGPDTNTYVKLILPEDREKINSIMEKVLFNAKVGDMASFDYRILLPDGSVRTLHSERMIREVDQNRKAIRIIGIEQDITEHKKAEDARKESEQLYRAVFDNSQDGFQLVELIYDKNEKPYDALILKVNQAFKTQTGIEDANVVGKTMKEITPNIESYWFETYDKILKTVQSIHFENYNQDTKRYYDAYIFPYAKNVVGVLFRNITERKNLEKQLQNKERMAAIGATAGMVGHDLRNPLQSIIGEVYLAKSELKSIPNSEHKACVQESIQAIAEQISYMDKIVSDLQAFVKPVDAHKQKVDLKQLIVALLAQVNIPKNIQTNLQADDVLSVEADPQLLKRVLINLVTNAVQAMPQGGELTINAQTNAEGQVQITVEDTGEGIPKEIKPKIFTPLFTTKAKGQGFGLAVCKRVLEAQGGTINFESEAGKGTKFIVELPSK